MTGGDGTTRKSTLRAWGQAARRAQVGKDCLSRRIQERLLEHAAYRAAGTILFYVDVRDEVRTRFALEKSLCSEKRVVVPWCDDSGELELFRLVEMTELVAGRYGILEPRAELRESAERRVGPEELDLALVPGVAFDERGGRLGHGRGYYDKLLSRVRTDCPLMGLAFERQIAEEIPLERHDVLMDMVVTEKRVIRCQATK